MSQCCRKFDKGCGTQNSKDVSSSENANNGCSYPQIIAWNRLKCIETKGITQLHSNDDCIASAVELREGSKSRCHSLDSTDSTISEPNKVCCCPSHSENSNFCWKSKRRQIIRESSHAAGLDINARTTIQQTLGTETLRTTNRVTSLQLATFRRINATCGSHSFLDAQSREAQQQQCERVNKKISTSLPTTPNLSQLRRPKPVQYQRLALEAAVVDDVQQRSQPQKQQSINSLQQLQTSATNWHNSARIPGCEQSEQQQKKQRVRQEQMIISNMQPSVVGVDDEGTKNVRQSVDTKQNLFNKTNNANNNSNGHEYRNESIAAERLPTLTSNSLKTLADQSMKPLNEQHSINYYKYNQHYENNDNAPLLLPRCPPPLPLSSPQSLSAAQSTTASANSTESAHSTVVAKSTLAFCEHCCESASMASVDYAQGAYAERKKNSNGEDHDRCYGEHTDSVSDLSSYRFVSDEDEISACVAVNETLATERKLNNKTEHYDIKNKHNNNVKQDGILAKNSSVLPTTPSRTRTHIHYSCSSPPLSSPPIASSLSAQRNAPLPTLLSPAAEQTTKIAASRRASPTICCYTIDKPVSIHYNATVLEYISKEKSAALPTSPSNIAHATVPVPIPHKNTVRSAYRLPVESSDSSEFLYHEELLSTSLPSNYGSVNVTENNFQRTQRLLENSKPPPPEPPPKPKQQRRPIYQTTVYSSTSAPEYQSQLGGKSHKNEQFCDHTFESDKQKFRDRNKLVYTSTPISTIYVSSSVSKDTGNCALAKCRNTEQYWPRPSSRSHERSLSPEHCELLSCFGTVKNTKSKSAANIALKTSQNDERIGDAQGKENSRHCESHVKRNALIEIENDKEVEFVARSLSESSCLVSGATPIASEKCAIQYKNNHHQKQKAQHTRQQHVEPLIESPPSPSHHHNKNNNINNNNINNKRHYCGDFEQNQRSAANRKKLASTSVYAVTALSGSEFDVLDTHAVTGGRNSACGECNNNYNCKTRCRTEYNGSEVASPAHPSTASVASSESSGQGSQSSVTYLSSSLPKRTLRYDSYGRLKSERVSRLPTVTKSLVNGRKAASETRLHRAYQNAAAITKCGFSSSLSANNFRLTPTLCRKFNYLSDRFEDCVVEREELELNATAEESDNDSQQNQDCIVQLRDRENTNVKQISAVVKANTTHALHSISNSDESVYTAFKEESNFNFTNTVPNENQIYKSFSDTYNFVSQHKANQTSTNHSNIEAGQSNTPFCELSLKSVFTESDNSLPCQCSSKQHTSLIDTTSATSPTSPTSPISLLSKKSSGGLNQKNSQSLPSVPQPNGTQTRHWLSSETVSSSQQIDNKAGLDELQSNCSDQTTIFHLENECSLSATSLSPTSQTQPQSLADHALCGTVVLKRIPAIHSFGYIPQVKSSSQDSANVRENDGREIIMEKRRNTLDRFQRLGFGRKSTPVSSGASSESSGSSRNRKSTEKSERLRELTELLRGNRSSPTPPPIPPPRKPRHGSHSASNSLERADTQTHPPAIRTASAGASFLDNTPLSHMSMRSDDIMLMNQEDHAANSHASKGARDAIEKNLNNDTKAECNRSKTPSLSSGVEAAAQAAATTKTPASSARLYDTLKPNTSLANFESLMLMSREKSKSPPPRSSNNMTASGSAKVDRTRLAVSPDIATKLTRPESRTIIGLHTCKGIPFRSASFSQIDISSGKYKKSSWSALRDRLWRDKVVGSVDSATSAGKGSSEETNSALMPAGISAPGKLKSEPDWIYIPLKKKTEMSINLNYQDTKDLENVTESPDIIPEEDIFNTDGECPSNILGDCTGTVLKHNLVIAHAKMESLTDTIQSENDYTIDAEEIAIAIESVPVVVDLEESIVEKVNVIEQPTIQVSLSSDVLEPNLATLMEERMQLESPPDNFLQTATTCLIPVPVYECAAQEWRLENPPQEWVEVQPEEFGIIPETIEPLLSLSDCVNVKSVPKTAQEYRVENVPTISVSRSSEEADDKCILRKKETSDEEFCDPVERRQASIDTAELCKRYSHDDIDVGKEKRASLDAITTRHSADERKRIDKSKRRKGMYIDNAAWSEAPDAEAHNRSLALNISLANINAIKPPTTEECDIMYINSPPTDENRTPGSLYSPEINTPESDKPPMWTKADRLASFSLQSSEEKDDAQAGVGSAGSITSRNNKSCSFLRTDSVSDNESDRGASLCREHTSPSPIPGDYDFKRFSKRPLRGPYGQMLEKEMKKANKMHFEEILEDLRESEISTQTRRPRIAYDDSSAITMNTPRNIPHHSNSMRVRKSNTFLPVPAHTRAASTPSQMENVSKGSDISGLEKINPHEKRYQSTLDNSVTSHDKDYIDAGHHYPHHHHQQREIKRAASEVPLQKINHSKRSQSMSGEKPNASGIHIVHQAKRSLDATTGQGSAEAKTGASKNSTIVPSQELLAELLKGSSEKLISEQRKQMAADTRTHVVQEILRNEQSYVESLQTIVTKYLKVLKSPEHAGMIDSRTVDEIFFMVPDILEIHEKFHAELKLRWDGWDTNQKVGDVFLETFSKLEVLEVYTSFVNNCNRAKNAIRSTKHQRPSFAKFLEMTSREHKGKLTLDNLLIKPVQKFPNYEMLFQRLIKHTDREHPDQKHLQDVLKLVHDILVHINCKEREILENGQREATLRELEGVIEGITDLITPDRQFLLFDLVSMPSGQGARKERGFFLFNDLLVLTSIKKRSGTIRKPNPSTCPGTVASTLDTNKYKFLTRISLDCLEIVKTKDENVKRIMNEIENLAEDCNKLQQIADITASLKYPHQYLEDVIRELLRDVQRQLSERQTNDTQLNMLELLVNSPNGSQKLSIVFSKSEKRTQWEETFNEAKQKLTATLERHPIPEFLMSIPIRKTRAGLQFTCAAATLSEKRDVWVCNSDGYVGQVCIMSLYPEPNVTSCNGVCNARILCVASVPAYNPNNRNSANSGTQPQQLSQQTHPRSASTTPQHSYTQQLRDYRKSISPNFQPPTVIGTPEKKKTTSAPANSAVAGAGVTTDNGNGTGSADNQLDLNLSSSDDETDTGMANIGSSGGAACSNGSNTIERVPSPAPSTQTIASVTLPGSSSSGTPSHHSHQDSNPDDGEGNLSTMWIGTEDGCIHVYNSTDNIRIKKNRIKIEHQSAVYSILYLDNRVFVSLANGDICVYLRDGVAWNTSSSHCLSIGTVTSPVTKLLNVHGKLWCSIQGIIKVLDTETLLVVNQIQISSDSKPITNMTVSNNYVWISIQNSAHIKCFHSMSHQLIAEVNLAPAVNKMLSNCDEIIRQHKAACLRVTSLLSCRDLIWIGTSAGVLLTIPAQGFEKGVQNVVPTGIPHGHTGHVRFLTFVETSSLTSEGSGSSTGSAGRDSENAANSTDCRSQSSAKHSKPKSESSTILVISGGDGYEDFRNSGANSLSEIAGREDSTNHLLIWQI